MSKTNPTPEYLRQCFQYDAETGKLWWRIRPIAHFADRASRDAFTKRNGRKRAGLLDKTNGYRRVVLDGRVYREHRLILALATGAWPEDDVDHINHVRDDNRLENLRVAGKKHNGRNHSLYRSNKSGVSGVYWHHGAWKARIRPDGRTVYLGTFQKLDDAKAAVIKARAEHEFHKNHGAASV